jgi:hypothetical protein
MIEDAPIVNDTRRVRELISQHFEHDIDRYLDYLCAQTQDVVLKIPVKKKVRAHVRKASRQRIAHATN